MAADRTINVRLAEALTNRYRIERELGQGGMATVYLAEDVKHHRKVAIKVLHPELSAVLGPDRFLNEIELTASLQHPHILPLFDSGNLDGLLFYVMPYVEGETLRNRLEREHQLPIADAIRIATEVADALEYAHKRQVIHRDIKPENILLHEGRALVADFGIALAASRAGGSRLTETGISLGTPAYMSPEQALGEREISARSDIYSLGCVLYEMLAGDLPFSGPTAQSITARKLSQPVPSLRNVRETVSETLEHAVEKALAKVPADRHDSCREFADTLHGPAAEHSTPAVGSPGRSRSWIGWLVGGGLVVGAALALTMTRRLPAPIVIGKRTAVAVGENLELFPSISPDGRTVVYSVTTSTTTKLFVQQVDGGSSVPVATQLSGPVEQGAFSPDGTRLLFRGPEGLYVMPALGGQARLVVHRDPRHSVSWGSWAPDGKRFAYIQRDTVFIGSIDETERTAIAEGVDLHSTAWSTDAEWLLFVSGNSSFHEGGNIAPSALRLVRVTGGPVIALTDSLKLNTSPIWVPGKRSVLFISDRDGGRDIYQMFVTRSGMPDGQPIRLTTGLNPERIGLSADGRRLVWSVLTRTANIWSVPIPTHDSLSFSEARQETFGTQQIENLSVSRDGQWLYYDSNRNGNQDIWRKPLRGGEAEMLTTDSADDFQPAVSPDGREVGFHSMRTGNRDIFVIPAIGGPATRISSGSGEDNDVTWSPDGRALIWTSNAGETSAWIARRDDKGTWGQPALLPLGPGPSLRMLRWSPDDHWMLFSDSAGMELWSRETGESRILAPGVFANFVAWSEDSRALYGLVRERAPGRVAIMALTVATAKLRILAYADNPQGPHYGSGFAVRDGRLYFTLTDVNSDVWVGEVMPR